MRLPIIFATAIILAATPALAARWEAIGQSTKGNQIFIDASKLKGATGDVRAVAYRVLFAAPVDLDGRSIASSRIDARFDCRSGLVTTDKITLFTDADGTKPLAQKRERVPLTVKEPAGSSGDVARLAVCK